VGAHGFRGFGTDLDARIAQLSMTGAGQPYRMSFGVGGLMINESVEMARQRIAGLSWDEVMTHGIAQGTTSLPKAASRRRMIREIINRLSNLLDEELTFLVNEADRDECAALLWVATCRAYRLVREFAVEVVCDRYLSYERDLPLGTFDRLLASKADWNKALANLNTSTARKLRQILFRMMREAGIITEDNCILATYLSPRVVTIITSSSRSDLAVFPGLGAEGQ